MSSWMKRRVRRARARSRKALAAPAASPRRVEARAKTDDARPKQTTDHTPPPRLGRQRTAG